MNEKRRSEGWKRRQWFVLCQEDNERVGGTTKRKWRMESMKMTAITEKMEREKKWKEAGNFHSFLSFQSIIVNHLLQHYHPTLESWEGLEDKEEKEDDRKLTSNNRKCFGSVLHSYIKRFHPWLERKELREISNLLFSSTWEVKIYWIKVQSP